MKTISLINIKTVINLNFCDDRNRETGQVIFSKCDLDLILIYEVSLRASSNILMGLYTSVI